MIETLKDLKQFLQICRKAGVTQIAWKGLSVTLGEVDGKAAAESDQPDEIPTEELTPEQLIYYSAMGGAIPPVEGQG